MAALWRNSLNLLLLSHNMVAGACFEATKTDVACFSSERLLGPMAIPDICGNGHLLTPDNVKMDQAKRRWRCLRCGRMRAAEFRVRHKPAAKILVHER